MIIMILLATFLTGVIIGTQIQRLYKRKDFVRCVEIANLKNNRTCRCELRSGHIGPHLYTADYCYSNAGEKLWWE